MRRIATLACFILIIAHTARAETLIVPSYPGAPWKKITDRVDNGTTWIEWIPSDQSDNDIHDILTEQIFPGHKGTDPSAFAQDWLKRLGGKCARLRINGPKPDTENGHAVAYAQAYCTGAGGKDVDIFFKALGGKDALYVVQREFRRPAEPGATPGVRMFTAAQIGELKAKMEAQSTANDFLVSQVHIADDAGAAAAAPKPEWPVESVTTEKEVRDKLGRPLSEDHTDPRRAGEYVLMYEGKDGTMYGFLFNKDHVVKHLRVYSRTAP